MFITSVLKVSQQKHPTAWPLSSNSGRSDIQLRAVFEEYKSVLFGRNGTPKLLTARCQRVGTTHL